MYHVRLYLTDRLKSDMLLSYTCQHFDEHAKDKFFVWNVSVSEHCCQHCDGVIFKADSVIETKQQEDECRTLETSVCRVLPGIAGFLIFLHNKSFLLFSSDQASAIIEVEFKYKQCCDDNSGNLIFVQFYLSSFYRFEKIKLNQT